jgi:hypothetical protein
MSISLTITEIQKNYDEMLYTTIRMTNYFLKVTPLNTGKDVEKMDHTLLVRM